MDNLLAQAQSEDDIIAYEQDPLGDIIKHSSTYELIKESTEKHSDQKAYSFLVTAEDDEVPVIWTYKKVMENIHQAANLFHKLGIEHTDAIANLMPNLPETYSIIFGGQAQGISASINPLLDANHIAGILLASEAKVLVTVGPMPEPGLWEKTCAIAGKIPSLTHIIAVDMGKYYGLPKVTLPNEIAGLPVLNFDEAIEGLPDDHLTSKRVFKPSDPAAYFHTGGTTGVPKLAIHTHANEVYQGTLIGIVLDFKSKDSIICGLPLFHVFGAIVLGIGTLARGVHMVIATPAGFRTPAILSNFWKITERYQLSFLATVPTVYSVLSTLSPEGNDISCLKGVFSGAAPLPVETQKRFKANTGIEIFEGYGLTEATAGLSLNPIHGRRKIGSVGLRVPYHEIKIMGQDEKGEWTVELPRGVEGILVAKGPTIFPGYKQSEKNKDAFFEDGWLNTGDLVTQDEDGYFWITGRAKDIIIRGGHNIDPSIIEETLSSHPSVAMSAAVGEPDMHVGEVPVAFASLLPGKSATEEELLKFTCEKINSGPEKPRYIKIIPAIPQTAVGKIFKPDLRVMAIDKAFTEALETEGLFAQISSEMTSNEGLVIHVKPKDQSKAQEVSDLLGQFVTPFLLDNHS